MAAPLVQLTRGPSPGGTSRPIPVPVAAVRKPSWIKVKAPGGENYIRIKQLMRTLDLHTRLMPPGVVPSADPDALAAFE